MTTTETVNLTPLWQAIVQVYLVIYKATDDPKTLREIENEFDRMAKLADKGAQL